MFKGLIWAQVHEVKMSHRSITNEIRGFHKNGIAAKTGQAVNTAKADVAKASHTNENTFIWKSEESSLCTTCDCILEYIIYWLNIITIGL